MSVDLLYSVILSMVLSWTILWGLVLGIGLILSLQETPDAPGEYHPAKISQ